MTDPVRDRQMNTREVRLALEQLKILVDEKEFGKLSNEQKASLCQMIHVGTDDIGIALAVEAINHPLTATIKKKRGTFYKRKFYLDGVLEKSPQNRFETLDEAQQFAHARGIAIV